MAEKLTDFAFPKTKRGRPVSYPWNEWLDGHPWRLTRGQDFSSTVHIFRGMATTTARRRGFKLCTHIESEKVLVIQASPQAEVTR